MVILAKLDRKDWIDIFAIAVPCIISIALFIISHIINWIKSRRKTYEPLDEWKRHNLCIRIFFHRFSAIVTILIVLKFIWSAASKTYLIRGVLIGMVVLEAYWSYRSLKLNFSRSPTAHDGSWISRTIRWIENHVILRYKGTSYPVISLLVEALIITYLCIISGGISSPFVPLFVYFCALSLYVSFSCTFKQSAIHVITLWFFFLAIFYLGDLRALILGINFVIPASFSLQVSADNSKIFLIIFFYSTALSGLLFLGIATHYAEQAEEKIRLYIKQTQDILAANGLRNGVDYRIIDKDSQIFLIKHTSSFDPDNALVLLPYCSRGKYCRIRNENESKPWEEPVNGEHCLHCEYKCPIGEIIDTKIGGKHLAVVEVIGTSHKIDLAVNQFCRNRRLNHIITVCCTSNLAKYLPEFLTNPRYKDTSLIYTPLLEGTEVCLSSIDPSQNRRSSGKLPLTWFDVRTLITCLKSLVDEKNRKEKRLND